MKTNITRFSLVLLMLVAVVPSQSEATTSIWTEVFTSSVPFSTVSRVAEDLVAVSGSSVARSEDGTNWTVETANMALSSWCASSPGAFLGVATLSNAVWVVASSDLTTWTVQDQVRFLGQDLLRWSCIASTTNRSLCILDIQPWGWTIGGPWRYLYSTEPPSTSWQETAPDVAAPHHLSSTPERFYCIAYPDYIVRSSVYSSEDGEMWHRLSPLWLPPDPFPVSYYIAGYSVYEDLVLSVHGDDFGYGQMGVYAPMHDDFLRLPSGPENPAGHDVVHYAGHRIAIAGSQTLFSGTTEYFILWTDDFATTWWKQVVPIEITGFASSRDATIAVGTGHFFLLQKPAVTTTNLPRASFADISVDAGGTNAMVGVSVETGTVYQLQVSTSLVEGVWCSYGLPLAATSSVGSVQISGMTNTPYFIKGKTLFRMEEE